MWTLLIATATAGDFDHQHAAFDAVLDGAVSERGVDYGAIIARRPALDAYMATLAVAPVTTFSTDQQLAFWINAYNAATLTLITGEWPVASIMDLDSGNPWDARTFRVGGQTVTLNDIEHRRVRPIGDARIHAAVNCASVGCPPLASDAFTAAGIDAELDAATRVWVAHNAVRVHVDSVQVNQIFEWYAQDFTAWAAARDLPVTPPHAASLAFLSAYGAQLPANAPSAVTTFPYDWSLNIR